MQKKTISDVLDRTQILAQQAINKLQNFAKTNYKWISGVDPKIRYSVIAAIIIGGTIIVIRKRRSRKVPQDVQLDYLMRGVIATGFQGIKSLKTSDTIIKPQKIAPNEVIIEVKAASIDSVDIRILHNKLSTSSYSTKNIKSLVDDIVLIPGRDCAGIIREVGEEVQALKPDDEVWAFSPPWECGLMRDFAVVCEDQVAIKPKNIDFENASSIPYAALLTWNALVNQANLNPETAKNKRVLIHLGSYSIGAIGIQLAKLWGAHVTTTVPTMGLPLVRYLGADDVIVYSVIDFEGELLARKKFDVVFNTAGSILHDLSVSICAENGFVVSAVAPFPKNLVEKGPFYNLFNKTWLRTKTELFQIFSNGSAAERWENLTFDKNILDQIKELMEKGKIQPIVEEVFPFQFAIKAFERVSSGDTVGRTVIKF